MKNKSAFPSIKEIIEPRYGTSHTEADEGISQRLYVATKIAAGIMSDGKHHSPSFLARDSFEIADELIKQDNE